MSTTLIPVGPIQVQMQDEGDAIVRMIKNGKEWEPMTRQNWHALVDYERAVIDVGAYTGIYSIASALQGAKVYAIEPHRTNFQRLRNNAAINSVKITMHEVVASDIARPMLLQAGRPMHQLCDTCTVSAAGSSLVWPIRAITIDGLGIPQQVGLIKIDVEGHELKVLHGAVTTLHMSTPMVLVECLNEQARLDVLAFMSHHGYVSHDVLDRRNYLYVHSGAV